MKKLKKSEKDWEKKLSPEEYHVLRKKGTEPPFTGKYNKVKEEGVYRCAACGNSLFSSKTKFDSGTGWPSFTNPEDVESVELREDNSYGMRRTEVICKKCGSHLGHVFDDSMEPNKKRFCINSVCLRLEKE